MNSQDRNQFEVNQTKSEENINTKDFMIGALIGGMVGAATALFLAPKSGKELQSDLNEKASVLKEKSGQFRETAMTKGTELATVAKEKTNALTQTVTKQSNEIVNKVKSMKESQNANGQASENGAAEGASDLASESINAEGYQPEGNAPVNDAEIQMKLEETKQAFDETEQKYNQ
ncbi:YtxH domain-containing protein [Bacillus sp. ISL-47]|uniref:YtxH domain-containing protein n=1 Tax=Bacillus sp. ISL-47 TaxID=2819130 RepID=UPI001BE93905|nr:YtxH domain-containing protein [Bacillus sp. ISL-47]MBT2691175.1 YtxH domain-containing protein [Bacillus sp. ISL-47]MBT2710323.1 YtxH domain-containing protein [Pseudomonas sp. ISL-84]